MPSINEEIRERAEGSDEVAGLRVDVTKVEGYLKELILWIRILITSVLITIVWSRLSSGISSHPLSRTYRTE